MTWVDLVVFAVLAISALLAFMRGLVREVLGLGAWVGAVAAAVWTLPYARPRFQEWLGTSPWIDPVAFGVVLLVTLIVLLLISRWIGALVRASPIGGIDRTLGLVFGLVRGAALVILAYIATGMVIPLERWPEPVLEARSLCLRVPGCPLGERKNCQSSTARGCMRPHRAARPRRRPCCTPTRKAGLSANRSFVIRRAKA